MTKFFLMVVVLYTIPHLALFARLYPVLTAALRLPVLLAILGMMATFFTGFSLRRSGVAVPKIFLDISFFWMAFIFWTFCAGLLMDGWNLLIRLVPLSVRPPALPVPLQIRMLVGMTIFLFAWSSAQGRRVQVQHLQIPGLTASRAVRIAIVTDLHLNPVGNHAAASRAIALLEALKPDMVISGGDLLDSPPWDIREDLGKLAAIKPPLGKFAVTGNHEYYSGIQDALLAHEMAGFQVLREKQVEPVPGLILAGVDDLQGFLSRESCLRDEAAALPPATNKTVILIKHRPVVSPTALERADLQISGHTHGGQLFPFHGLVRLVFPRISGLHTLSRRLKLYVSNGAGTWGPPLRLLAPPEVVLLTIPAAP
ncbi:MAG: metallophosphoesterase [Kiritimatiellia bacterium]